MRQYTPSLAGATRHQRSSAKEKKICSLVQKETRLNNIIGIFKCQHAKLEDIADAGARFLVALYGGDMDNETLEEVRYKRFIQSTTKSKLNLASLPPTMNAARYHAFRTYHQVQKWCGIEKDPEVWGWKLDTNGLLPVTMTEQPAPNKLLNLIFCSCKKGCSKACSCRKAGLKCSLICQFCNGESCENTPNVPIESESEDDENLSAEFQVLSDRDEFHDEDEDDNIDRPGPSKRIKT